MGPWLTGPLSSSFCVLFLLLIIIIFGGYLLITACEFCLFIYIYIYYNFDEALWSSSWDEGQGRGESSTNRAGGGEEAVRSYRGLCGCGGVCFGKGFFVFAMERDFLSITGGGAEEEAKGRRHDSGEC